MRYSLTGNVLTRGEGPKAKSMTFTSIQSGADAQAVMDGIHKWDAGALIQSALPNLTNDEREFIMTGITPDEWEAMFGGEREEMDAAAWKNGRRND